MKYTRYIPNDNQINIWFYLFFASIALFIGYVFHDVFKDEEGVNAEELIAEYSARCPKGYVFWTTIDYLEPVFVMGARDSIMMFEKQIRSGCRLSLTGRETPEMIQGMISHDPVVDSVHHSEVFGSVHLKSKYVVNLDSFSGTSYMPNTVNYPKPLY